MDKRSKITNIVFLIGKKIAPQSFTNFCKIKYYAYKANKNKREYDKLQKKDSYLKLYQKYIDDKANNFKITDMDTGRFDLNILKKLGLKKNNNVFEFGVGYLRSSKHFVEYLDSGKYTGNDTSSERIERGKKILPNMKKKNANLLVTNDNSLDWLKGKKFDFIYSNAVFCHMPEKDIKETLKNIYKKAMHKKSKFIFSYSELDFKNYRSFEKLNKENASKKAIEFFKKSDLLHLYDMIANTNNKDFIQLGFCNWWHSKKFIQNICKDLGFKVEDVSHLLSSDANKTLQPWERFLLLTI